MEKIKFFYGEFLLNSENNTNCSSKKKLNNGSNMQQLRWMQAKKTLKEYSETVDFEYIGLSGEDPLCNPEIKEFLYGVRKLYKNSFVILITDGKKLLEDSTVIDYMIDISPARLYIVLQRDWYEFSIELDRVIRMHGYRFMKLNCNNPIKGIKYILLKKGIDFYIELYIHVPVNLKMVKVENFPLHKLEKFNLFKSYPKRKSMPVLVEGKILKCTNVKYLWDYYKKNKIDTSLQAYIEEVLEESTVFNKKDAYKLKHFFHKSKICDSCCGCIECIVNQKGSTD